MYPGDPIEYKHCHGNFMIIFPMMECFFNINIIMIFIQKHKSFMNISSDDMRSYTCSSIGTGESGITNKNVMKHKPLTKIFITKFLKIFCII